MRWLRSKQRRLSHLYETEISQPTPLYFCLARLVTWTTMDALCSRLAGNFKMQFNDIPLFPCNLFAVGTISGKENPEQMRCQTGCGSIPENSIPMGSESACLPYCVHQFLNRRRLFTLWPNFHWGLQTSKHSELSRHAAINPQELVFLRFHQSQWRSCKISFLKK